MDFKKQPSAQTEPHLFVEWDGRWYGVPDALVPNLRKAGLTVCRTPPGAASSAHISMQDNGTEE